MDHFNKSRDVLTTILGSDITIGRRRIILVVEVREYLFCQKLRAKLVKITGRSCLKRPELWRQKRRCSGIDTVSRASNFETHQSRTPLLNALSGDTPQRFHWIESGSQHGHVHGRVEADAMDLASSRFAR